MSLSSTSRSQKSLGIKTPLVKTIIINSLKYLPLLIPAFHSLIHTVYENLSFHISFYGTT